MITTTAPATWQDLQEQTAAILSECGFAVAVEKTLRTARGEVEVDVVAEETVKGRRYLILCECKHWKNPVPQAVIHAFRTTVAEIGANVGYVISSNGFQSGAFAASELTNLKLVTWPEFQAMFEESWLDYFAETLRKRLDALLSYTEPFLPKWFDGLPEQDQDAFIELKEKHDALGHLVTSMGLHIRRVMTYPLPTLPLARHFADQPEFLEALPPDILDVEGYRELLGVLLRHGEAAIAEFRAIRDRNGFAPPNVPRT